MLDYYPYELKKLKDNLVPLKINFNWLSNDFPNVPYSRNKNKKKKRGTRSRKHTR